MHEMAGTRASPPREGSAQAAPYSEMDDRFKSSAAKLGVGVALILLAFSAAVIQTIDGASMLSVSVSLLTNGSFAVPPWFGFIGRNGHYYSGWYPLLSVVALPFVGPGLLIARLFHLPANFAAGACALTLSALLVAGTSYLTTLLAHRLGASARNALIAGLGFAFGTIGLVYAREFFAEPLLALLTVWAIFLEVGGSRHERNGASVLSALAVLAKPSGIVVGPLLAAHSAIKTHSIRTALGHLCGTGVGLALYFAYNFARFGHLFTFGLPNKFSLDHLPAGLSGLLLSPGRGLFWYCPIVISLVGLGWSRLRRLDTLLIIGVFGAYLGLYSLWGDWDGGWCWGPRLLLPAIPGLVALTGLLGASWRRLVAVLILLGFVVTAPTLVSAYDRIYWERAVAGMPPASQWSLSEAPLVRIWGVTYREISDARHTDVKDLVRTVENPNREKGDWRVVRTVAIWWWMLPAAGIPRALGIFISVALCLIGISLIFAAMYPALRLRLQSAFA